MTGESCIYEGTLRHRRTWPITNEFTYPLFFTYLDLDELPDSLEPFTGWSARRPALAWFRRKDHVGPPDVPLATHIRDLVAERTGSRPGGPIRMLTHLRYLGHCFNPVSFYYCYDEAGQEPVVVVAAITNTPWHERHCYVLGPATNEATGGRHHHRFPKAFHVSPFMPMDCLYEWNFSRPGRELNVHFVNHREGGRVFDATLRLRRHEMEPGIMRRVLWHYPAQTMTIVARIHYQALRLWWKGATFHVHPRKLARRRKATEDVRR